MSRQINLNSPVFNLREIVKQMLLLEDHLNDDVKFCHDCIRKHMMMIEALAEEAVALDKSNVWVSLSQKLAKRCRKWIISFVDGVNKHAIAQNIRQVRKGLTELVFDPRNV